MRIRLYRFIILLLVFATMSSDEFKKGKKIILLC